MKYIARAISLCLCIAMILRLIQENREEKVMEEKKAKEKPKKIEQGETTEGTHIKKR